MLTESQRFLTANQILVHSFERLPMNWNGYGAQAIPSEVVAKTLRVLEHLEVQPVDIFPTGRGSTQLEYDLPDRSIEIEIGADEIRFLLIDGESEREWTSTDLEQVTTTVADFHAAREYRER